MSSDTYMPCNKSASSLQVKVKKKMSANSLAALRPNNRLGNANAQVTWHVACHFDAENTCAAEQSKSK